MYISWRVPPTRLYSQNDLAVEQCSSPLSPKTMSARRPSIPPSPTRSLTRSLCNPRPVPVQTTVDPDDDSHPDSESALLAPKPTPLPIYQLFIVYLMVFTGPLTTTVVYPFINQLVRDTGIVGGDERKTGYYAGMIVGYRCGSLLSL